MTQCIEIGRWVAHPQAIVKADYDQAIGARHRLRITDAFDRTSSYTKLPRIGCLKAISHDKLKREGYEPVALVHYVKFPCGHPSGGMLYIPTTLAEKFFDDVETFLLTKTRRGMVAV